MFVVCCSFENVLINISRLLGHFQLVNDGTWKGREWDGDEDLYRHNAIHLAQEALHTGEIVLQGQSFQTLGAVNTIARHYLNWKIRM